MNALLVGLLGGCLTAFLAVRDHKEQDEQRRREQEVGGLIITIIGCAVTALAAVRVST